MKVPEKEYSKRKREKARQIGSMEAMGEKILMIVASQRNEKEKRNENTSNGLSD